MLKKDSNNIFLLRKINKYDIENEKFNNFYNSIKLEKKKK